MKDVSYSNREIDRMFQEIKTLLVDIKTQTTLTNGRVTKIETWRDTLMGKIVGGGAVIAFVWTIVWAVLSKKL